MHRKICQHVHAPKASTGAEAGCTTRIVAAVGFMNAVSFVHTTDTVHTCLSSMGQFKYTNIFA